MRRVQALLTILVVVVLVVSSAGCSANPPVQTASAQTPPTQTAIPATPVPPAATKPAAPSAAAPAPAPTVDPSKLPLVKVLATGGTIVNVGTRQDFQGMKGQDLIDSLPDIAQYARIEVEQIVNLPSSKLTPDVWLVIGKRINEIFATEPGVSGIVVTHGTDTMEETAYFLNLTVRSDKPVVLTGAQIQRKYVDSDGTRNLTSAIRLAGSPSAKGKGAMILFNERQIISARNATKVNTVRVDGFSGGELGFLGYVDEDGIWFYHSPARRHTLNSEFDISKLEKMPQVDIVYSYSGVPGTQLASLTAAGVKGIVIAGSGAGGTTPEMKDAGLAAISKGIVVVMATRVREGRTRASSVDVGLRGDNLSPQKARILLALALTKTSDPKEIQRMFDEY